jgi:hypothetical protein
VSGKSREGLKSLEPVLVTAFDDDVEVKFVGKRKGQEGCEDAILERDGRKISLERAAAVWWRSVGLCVGVAEIWKRGWDYLTA